jgi:hypothetical protein
MPDVGHDRFSVKVKYRARLPYLLRAGLDQAARYDRSKVPPLLVVKQKGIHGALEGLRLRDLVSLLEQAAVSVNVEHDGTKRDTF